jgi:hypothetical protein
LHCFVLVSRDPISRPSRKLQEIQTQNIRDQTAAMAKFTTPT